MAWIYKKLKEEDYEGMEEMWSSFPDCAAVYYDDGSTCIGSIGFSGWTRSHSDYGQREI